MAAAVWAEVLANFGFQLVEAREFTRLNRRNQLGRENVLDGVVFPVDFVDLFDLPLHFVVFGALAIGLLLVQPGFRLAIPLVDLVELLEEGLVDVVCQAEARLDAAKRLKELHLLHDLDPLDEVVSVEKVQVLQYVKTQTAHVRGRLVDEDVDHGVLQDEEVEEAVEEYFVVFHGRALLADEVPKAARSMASILGVRRVA